MATATISPQTTESPIIQKFLHDLYDDGEITTGLEKKGRAEFLVYKVPDQVEAHVDRFNACHLQVFNAEGRNWKDPVTQLAERIKQDPTITSLWLNYPNPASDELMYLTTPRGFAAGAAGKSDQISDMQTDQTRRWMWLSNDECTIPCGATHNIGARGVLIDTVAQKVLLINENAPGPRGEKWDLPGGGYDPIRDEKDLRKTALNECLEEGGIERENIETQSRLIGQVEWANNPYAPAINQTYAIYAENISQKPLKPPENEIKRAKWFTYAEILEAGDKLDGLNIGVDVKAPIQAAINGLGCQIVEANTYKRVWVAQPGSE